MHDIPNLAEEIFSIDISWERDSPFSLRVQHQMG